MANKNDYNYYKNEYGKYKEAYYSPGSEKYKKSKSSATKQQIGRFFRAFFVFLIISSVVVGIVFGIIKLSAYIRDKADNKPETTTEITTDAGNTTNKDDQNGSALEYIVKTESGNGIYMRNKPTYDVKGFTLIKDGESIIVAEISDDGEWAKTANFEKNGWVNIKYLVSAEESETEAKTTEKETTTEKEKTTEKETTKKETTTKKESTTEGKTQTDTNITSYADAVKAFKEKGSGAVMNCKIVGSGNLYAYSKPDVNSAKILWLESGESVKVVRVDGEYSKIVKLGFESSVTWVPNENLTFVSWG